MSRTGFGMAFLWLRFELRRCHREKLTCDGECIAWGQDHRSLERRCRHVSFARNFVAELECNGLQIAVNVNGVPGLQQKSLSTRTFGCCHYR